MVSAQPILVVVLMVMMIVLLKVHRKHGDGTSSVQYSSVQFSCLVVSDSLWPHELQHARPPCPSPTPGVHSNSHPSSWWCHPAISSSVIPFHSCPHSLPASVFSNESTLHMRWPKYWSFSLSIIPSKEIPGLISFRMHLNSFIPLCLKTWQILLCLLENVKQEKTQKSDQKSHSIFFLLPVWIHSDSWVLI